MGRWVARRYGRWVQGRTVSGRSYPRVEWTVPPIRAEYLDCVVFLYPSVEAARVGNTASGGTGFLGSTALDRGSGLGPDQPRALYVVTNAHCAVHTPVVRLNTEDGDVEIIEPQQSEWHYHPNRDDVAVLPLGLRSEHPKFQSMYVESNIGPVIDEGHLFSETKCPRVQPGTDAFFVARYVTVSGVQRNLPVVRFGAVAMAPTEPIERPDGTPQDSFLVEARSQNGFSGSPVFVYDVLGGGLGNPYAGIGNIAMLGIVWGHLPTPTGENSNMACVVPAWKIVELIETKELVNLREEQKRKLDATPHAVEDAAIDENDEFERFEDLTRKLVQTPKSEIDEQRKED